MIKIIIIRGGLGNQMFGYAFSMMLKKRYPFCIVLLDPIDSWNSHNGYELSKLFQPIKLFNYKSYKRLRKLYTKYITKWLFNFVKEEEQWGGTFNLQYLNNSPFFQIYDGYWQTEEYFKSVERVVRKHFVFNTEQLNEPSLVLLKQIKQRNAVSIHIRRCDYLELSAHQYFGNICTVDYYHRAIRYILQKQKDVYFYFFSDDPTWVQKNFEISNSTVVHCNMKEYSWQDMCLMSHCKHNIIANSSFSWWGAWLNNNRNKIVITPSKWTNRQPQKDIIPLEWIRISNTKDL